MDHSSWPKEPDFIMDHIENNHDISGVDLDLGLSQPFQRSRHFLSSLLDGDEPLVGETDIEPIATDSAQGSQRDRMLAYSVRNPYRYHQIAAPMTIPPLRYASFLNDTPMTVINPPFSNNTRNANLRTNVNLPLEDRYLPSQLPPIFEGHIGDNRPYGHPVSVPEGTAVNVATQRFDNDVLQDGLRTKPASRRSRAHDWPPVSDPHPRLPFPTEFESRTIKENGRNSGRNLLAIFEGTDGTPRTRYNLFVKRGRGPNYLREHGYPTTDVPIPGGKTLDEICREYPRHTWGTGLRLFIAENWTGLQVFERIPEVYRYSKARSRQWNFMQQGFSREVREINKEERGEKPIEKRKRKGKAVNDPNDDDDEDEDEDIAGGRRRPKSRRTLIEPRLSPSISGSDSMFVSSQSGRSILIPYLQKQERGTPGQYITQQETLTTPIERYRLGEMKEQARLLLVIMLMENPHFETESLEEQLKRVRLFQSRLCMQLGLNPNEDPMEELVDLTRACQRLIEHLKQDAIARTQLQYNSDLDTLPHVTNIEDIEDIEQLETENEIKLGDNQSLDYDS